MHAPRNTVLGVIGGSGVYKMADARILNMHKVDTSFGPPSDEIIECSIDDRRVFFLPRHGSDHQFLPSEVPYQANISALKQLGVTHVLAVSAVGIMQESIHPGHLVIPDQIFDRTKGVRPSTFFGEGVVGHVSFAEPFCAAFRGWIQHAAQQHTKNVHFGGTYLCMEGPQFSTRAESHFYRATLNPAVIGMTALPEAKLAREAELCYGMLALATDYDCWHDSEDDVSVEAVIQVLKQNSKLAQDIVAQLTRDMPSTYHCDDSQAAAQAIMTPQDRIPPRTRKRLEKLFGHYWHS